MLLLKGQEIKAQESNFCVPPGTLYVVCVCVCVCVCVYVCVRQMEEEGAHNKSLPTIYPLFLKALLHLIGTGFLFPKFYKVVLSIHD